MAAIDDYIQAGFSRPQALVLTTLTATASSNLNRLVQVGFSPNQAAAIQTAYAGGNDVVALARSGLWSGTQVAAINANM